MCDIGGNDDDEAEAWGRARISPFPRESGLESLTPFAVSVFSQEGTGAEGQKSVCVVFSDLVPGMPAVCGGADAVGLAETSEVAGSSASAVAVLTEAAANGREAV